MVSDRSACSCPMLSGRRRSLTIAYLLGISNQGNMSTLVSLSSHYCIFVSLSFPRPVDRTITMGFTDTTHLPYSSSELLPTCSSRSASSLSRRTTAISHRSDPANVRWRRLRYSTPTFAACRPRLPRSVPTTAPCHRTVLYSWHGYGRCQTAPSSATTCLRSATTRIPTTTGTPHVESVSEHEHGSETRHGIWRSKTNAQSPDGQPHWDATRCPRSRCASTSLSPSTQRLCHSVPLCPARPELPAMYPHFHAYNPVHPQQVETTTRTRHGSLPIIPGKRWRYASTGCRGFGHCSV